MSRTFHIEPGGRCQGRLRVPGDKSISHRALMLGAIARGDTVVTGLLESEDCLATAAALRAMGARIDRVSAGEYRIEGVGHGALESVDSAIDCGNSGTGMRLLTGLLAGQGVNATLIGDESLMSRPMGRVAKPLAELGARVSTGPDGCPPVTIARSEELRPATVQTGVASAQVKSALLLAGLGVPGETRVIEPAATRDHTERLLPAFGCPVAVDGLTSSLHGPAELTGCRVDVPADPSSAAFFAVAATLLPGSELTLTAVGVNPHRTGFIDILLAMGADIRMSNEGHVGQEPVADLTVRSASLRGIDVPPEWVARSIDEFPVLFVAAAAARGRTRVSGAAELKVKESDRLGAMAEGLVALGIDAQVSEDGIEIEGGRIGAGQVASHGDHRIAMAFAVAGAVADGPVRVDGVDNVATSFPNFAALAQTAGWRVVERDG